MPIFLAVEIDFATLSFNFHVAALVPQFDMGDL